MLGCLLPPHHYHHVPVTSLGRNTCFNTYSEYSLKMRQINATLNFISDLILIFDKKRPFTNHFLVMLYLIVINSFSFFKPKPGRSFCFCSFSFIRFFLGRFRVVLESLVLKIEKSKKRKKS